MIPLDLVKDIKPQEHYLRKPCNSYDFYIDDLCNLLNKLKKVIEPDKYNELIDKKLQTKLSKFNESQFIQTACELTVINDFLGRKDCVVEYEKKVTAPKDVDFTVSIKRINYNIEVKCPSFKVHEKENENDEAELHFANRAPSLEIRNDIVRDLKSRLEKNEKGLSEAKNLDNTMKDFLTSTHEKVKDSSYSDVNILVIGCNDELNLHEWRGYLFEYGGFFTDDSSIGHSEFDRVDYVLLTNIYNRHYKYFDSVQIRNHWNLSSSFNLLYPNRYSKRNKQVDGCTDLKNMNSIFPNHNISFEGYLNDEADLPDGEIQEMKKHVLGVAWYADKFKKDGIYYFREEAR